MPFSISSTIRQILADEQAKAVLEKYMPGASTHPQIDMAMGMTLREVATYPEANLSAANLKALVADLEKL